MIHTCHFNGRLGNNLFQIANLLSIQHKVGGDIILPHHTHAGHRGDIPVDLSIFGYDFKRGEIETEESYNQSNFHYIPIPLGEEVSTDKSLTLTGYYQSWRYFEEIRDLLTTKYFTPTEEISERINSYQISSKSLGISVRRGDYLMLQHNHCVLGIEYYQECINRLQGDYDSIFVFSDDLPWCREVFGPNVNYVESPIGEQFFLMTKMKHFIMSNSTFAWWGCYLNQQGGRIFVPDPWFGPSNKDLNTSDLIYPDWERAEHTITTHPYTLTPNMYN